MLKIFGKNLFGWSITGVLMVTILTVFCLDKFIDGAEIHQQVAITSNTSDSKLPGITTEDNIPVSSENRQIEVLGEDSNTSFHSMDFIDDQNGWIIEDKYTSPVQPSKLLRTQDGGLHWEKTGLKDMTLNKIKFVDKTVGWAIVQPTGETTSDADKRTMKILQTQDGGKSWSVQWEKKVNSTSDYDLWFQDTENGYALINGIFLSTRDGGKHWSTNSFGVDDFIPQHMSFASVDKGWVIGIIQKANSSKDNTQNLATKIMVLQTVDGGKQWHKQFDKNYSEGPVGGIDIDFINSSTGWFLTSDLATWNGELYYTSDGGVNWSKINQIKCVRPTPKELNFVTPQIGWIALDVGAGPIAGGLIVTRDGGKSFNVVGREDESGICSASEVNFISEQLGWAIAKAPNHGDYIIHTIDGGKTWSSIN